VSLVAHTTPSAATARSLPSASQAVPSTWLCRASIRHSYATAALAAGVPAKVVSERLGHATIAITLDVYSHVIPGMDAQAANAVASLILDGSSPQAKGPDQSPGPPLTND
jgi:site-specific recombinase XerC